MDSAQEIIIEHDTTVLACNIFEVDKMIRYDNDLFSHNVSQICENISNLRKKHIIQQTEGF